MSYPICNMRKIAHCCLAGEQLDSELSHWLGRSFLEFLERRCPTVDEALGLNYAHGGIPWWKEEAICIRNAALRQLAARFLDTHSLSAQARQIRILSCRYAASSWRHDKDRSEMPHRYLGTPTEYLWRAFRSGAIMPLRERHLRSILTP